MSGIDFVRHFIFCTVKFNKHSLETHCVPDAELSAKDMLLDETGSPHHHRSFSLVK